jgi:galactokinase
MLGAQQGLMMDMQPGPESVLTEFTRLFDGEPRLYQAPGRINIIGEHTDYNGGRVLPATIDLYTWAAMVKSEERLLRIKFCNENRTHSINLDELSPGGNAHSIEYIKGVVWALHQADLHPAGGDFVIGGNIPLGGGLSSSASLEVLLAYALLESSDIEIGLDEVARICQRAETDFVGVQCGIMDQLIISLGRAGHAMMLDCNSLKYEHLPISPEMKFLVIHSGVHRKLPAGLYNSRTEECAKAVAILQSVFPDLEFLSQLNPVQLESAADNLDEKLYRRARHVLTENQRVRETSSALMNGELELMGDLLTQSHLSLRDDYEVSCAELDQLVGIASECDGVYGSRMMGAGFGGCTISLVDDDRVDKVKDSICREYGKLTGSDPWMHVVGPGDAVRRIG